MSYTGVMFVGEDRPSPAAALPISASSHFKDCCCLSHHSTTNAPDAPPHLYTLSILFSSMFAFYWLVVMSHYSIGIRLRSWWNSFQLFLHSKELSIPAPPMWSPLSTVLP